MPDMNLNQSELRTIYNALVAMNGSGEFAVESQPNELLKRIEEQMERTVTVICKEITGTPDCLLYTVIVHGEITQEKITKLVRDIRREELGDDMNHWIERLEPVVVLEGDPEQLADWRVAS